jgi:hypothetical protein
MPYSKAQRDAADRLILAGEAKAYGVKLTGGRISAAEMDRQIQRKVDEDFQAGICSICKGAAHTGRCSR